MRNMSLELCSPWYIPTHCCTEALQLVTVTQINWDVGLFTVRNISTIFQIFFGMQNILIIIFGEKGWMLDSNTHGNMALRPTFFGLQSPFCKGRQTEWHYSFADTIKESSPTTSKESSLITTKVETKIAGQLREVLTRDPTRIYICNILR